jgi:hypothetical protein
MKNFLNKAMKRFSGEGDKIAGTSTYTTTTTTTRYENGTKLFN